MNIRALSFFAAVVCSTTFLHADVTDTKTQVFELPAKSQVIVVNTHGSIEVSTWDQSSIEVTAVRTARNERVLAKTHVKMEAEANTLKIRTEAESRDSEVRYTLRVPAHTTVRKAHTGQGNIRVEGLSGDIDATALNGSIHIVSAGGAVRAQTVKAPISISGTCTQVRAESVDGDIQLQLAVLPPASKILAHSVNGAVQISLPSDASVAVRASTKNGEVENSFGLPDAKRSFNGHTLEGQLGQGESSLSVETVNGTIALTKA